MNEFKVVNIELLEFDKKNPRLPTSVRNKDDASILKYLATETSIENLMTSIGENGFFPGEAMVVKPHESKYTVIEGNRRLTALRLLQDPALVKISSIDRRQEMLPINRPKCQYSLCIRGKTRCSIWGSVTYREFSDGTLWRKQDIWSLCLTEVKVNLSSDTSQSLVRLEAPAQRCGGFRCPSSI